MLKKLKTNSKKLRKSHNFFIKVIYYCLYAAWKPSSYLYKILFDSSFRSVQLLKIVDPQEAHQLSNYTKFNRYPELFLACQQLNNSSNINTLSYGCSTGE